MPKKGQHRKYVYGIFLAIMAALFSTLLGVLVKGVGHEFNPLSIIWYRDIVGILFLLPLMRKDKDFTFRIKSPVILFSRITTGLICMGTYFWACELIPITNAVLLLNTSPIFIPILLLILLKRKTNKKVILAIAISFIGMAIVINPTPSSFNIYSIVGLISGISLAFNVILSRTYVTRPGHSVNSLLFWYFGVCIIVTTPIVYFKWVTPSLLQLLLLLGTGVAGVLYQLTSNNSLKFISARVAACLSYLGIIWAGLFSWAFWGDLPTYLTAIGMLITVAGAILVIIYDEKSSEENNKET